MTINDQAEQGPETHVGFTGGDILPTATGTTNNLAHGAEYEDQRSVAIAAIHKECREKCAELLEQGVLELVYSDEEVDKQIDTYLQDNGEDILDFLGPEGKVFVAMNSAEPFADRVTDNLELGSDRISKVKISTYNETGESTGALLSEETKAEIRQTMNLKRGDTVLILEDLIDSGHTLKILEEFFREEGVTLKVLCLFDKDLSESEETRKILGFNLQTITKIKPEFVVGYGMDLTDRLCANTDGFLKVASEEKVSDFLTAMKPFQERIETVL